MHFFQADVPWQEQADFFLSTVKDKGFHFFVLDLEVKSEDGKSTFLADAEKWLKYVDDKVEQKVLLQTLGSYMTSFGTDGNWMKEWPLLIMQYPLEPDRNGSPVLPTGITDWKIWNYSDGRGMGAEYGVGGNDVYLEVFNGTPKDMWDWLVPTFTIYNRPSGPLVHPNQSLQVTELNNMVFSPDGTYLAAADKGMVYLFDPASGEEISTLYLGGRKILSLSFTLDSRLAIGTEDGTILLWKLGLLNVDTNPEPYRASACLVVKRDFTDPEWQQFFGDTPKVATCPDLP
jgi:WD40 repeat protein